VIDRDDSLRLLLGLRMLDSMSILVFLLGWVQRINYYDMNRGIPARPTHSLFTQTASSLCITAFSNIFDSLLYPNLQRPRNDPIESWT
jgi:hypothetical protein